VSKANWYVVQVSTGYEDSSCEAILRNCRETDELEGVRYATIEECFSPRYATRHKVHGQWVDDELLLLPGYVIAIAADPIRLARILRAMPDFAVILKVGEQYAPLSEDDKLWLDGWTSKEERTIPMSFAYKEGENIVVTDGPLKGREATISRINRRKCLAELEIRVGQRTVRTTVGLAVLPGDGV